MKTWKKVVLSVVSVILVIAIVGVGQMFIYYPHYIANKEAVTIEDIDEKGELRVMSCNLRCISPDDFGKKAGSTEPTLLLKTLFRRHRM